MFTELPEHLSCAFFGTNSPIVMRFEVATESGGIRVEEFSDAPPFITLYGDFAEAKAEYVRSLSGIAEFASFLDRASVSIWNGCWVEPRWFQIEIRYPTYRAMLYGEGEPYQFSYMLAFGDLDIHPIVNQFNVSHDRLKAVYEKFFAATL